MVSDGLVLNSKFCEMIGFIDAIVRSVVYWGFPAQVAHRLFSHKRNAFISNNVLRLLTDEGSVDALNSQRLVIVAV